MKNPDCFKCEHFYITVDERHPRGCKLFNIKGRNIPSIDVRRVTGVICPVFRSKKGEKKAAFSEDRSFDFMA